MRNVDALTLGDLPDGLAIKCHDLFAVQDELHRFGFAVARSHLMPFAITSFPAVSTIHPENILAHIAGDSAPPGPGRRSRHRAWPSKVLPRASHPKDPWPSIWPLSQSPPDMAYTDRSFRPRKTSSDSMPQPLYRPCPKGSQLRGSLRNSHISQGFQNPVEYRPSRPARYPRMDRPADRP